MSPMHSKNDKTPLSLQAFIASMATLATMAAGALPFIPI